MNEWMNKLMSNISVSAEAANIHLYHSHFIDLTSALHI